MYFAIAIGCFLCRTYSVWDINIYKNILISLVVGLVFLVPRTCDGHQTHFAVSVLAYPWFYSLSSRASISYPLPNFEPSTGLSGNVMQVIGLASRNSDVSLTSEWQLLYISLFIRFQYSRRFAVSRFACYFISPCWCWCWWVQAKSQTCSSAIPACETPCTCRSFF
jgi:hypothetical protein